ncbi:MAG: hypothetical protein QM831_39355 [Kofleriaceae bacterium]
MELSFDEPAGLSVFADQLISQGDPWGEVIAAQLAGHEELATKLIEQHRICAGFTIEWKHGFARTVTITGDPDPKLLRERLTKFFTLPQAQLCDGVVFAPVRATMQTTRDYGEYTINMSSPYADCEDLWKAVPMQVTRFGFGAWPNPPGAAAYVRMPGFRTVSGWFQRAVEMSFVGADHDVQSPFLLPNCKKLAIHCADMHRETLESLVRSELPVLEELWIGTGGDESSVLDDVEPPEEGDDGWEYPEIYPASYLDDFSDHGPPSGRFGDMFGLLAEIKLPAIKRLSLAGSVIDQRTIQQLAALPYLDQLHEIDLRDCALVPQIKDVAPLIDELRSRVPSVLGGANAKKPVPFVMRYIATME